MFFWAGCVVGFTSHSNAYVTTTFLFLHVRMNCEEENQPSAFISLGASCNWNSSSRYWEKTVMYFTRHSIHSLSTLFWINIDVKTKIFKLYNVLASYLIWRQIKVTSVTSHKCDVKCPTLQQYLWTNQVCRYITQTGLGQYVIHNNDFH